MAGSKLLVEYAKSSKSSCKICSMKIGAGSLRLGVSTRDPKGFDMVKWHHLNCHPIKSHTLDTLEEINGFSFLKSSDQDLLKKLVAEQSTDQSIEGVKRKEIESEMKILKKRKEIESETKILKKRKEIELETMILKKRKLFDREKEEIMELKFCISDVKNKYKDASLPPNWKAFDTIIFNEREAGLHDTEIIAAFDFDGCLVNTSVKRIGATAWSLMYPSIPEKLQELYNGGYKLVIFTNESNIERWKNKRQGAIDSKIGRLENFVKLVKVPIQVFIACGLGSRKEGMDDPFRKPMPGMWKIMAEHFNSGISIDMNRSFYVGDAAGRANDHSDADLKFAKAIGLKFHVPEEFFGA